MIRFEDISFVVQGPVDPAVTRRCLEEIRKHFPGSEIVLSTWEGSNLDGLDYDRVVLSTDPGAVESMAPGTPLIVRNNGNRQIISTKAGLKTVSRPFAAKIRSDLLLRGNSWLSVWEHFPKRLPDWRMFRERLIIGNLFARNPFRDVPKPFHPSDWFMFGLRQDLLLLWDVDLEPEPESSHWFRKHAYPAGVREGSDTRRYQAEQYLWKTLMQKFGAIAFDHLADASDENIRLTQLTFANNLTILDAQQFPLEIPRHGIPRRMWRYCCYTHKEWERLYQQYCCGKPVAAAVNRLLDVRHWAEGLYCFMPPQIRDSAWKVSTVGRQLMSSARAD